MVFSPDGGRLYCGSLDGVVYVYDALNNFKLVTRMYRYTHTDTGTETDRHACMHLHPILTYPYLIYHSTT